MSVNRLYLRIPGAVRAKHERAAAIRRAAIKAAALPPRTPVTSPVVRPRKSSSRPRKSSSR